jgi:hypothetical protein
LSWIFAIFPLWQKYSQKRERSKSVRIYSSPTTPAPCSKEGELNSEYLTRF